MRFFQEFAIEKPDAVDFSIACSHVTRLAPFFIAALVMLSGPALPSDGQITLVVGFAAGGTSSTSATIFAESIEHITRNSTVVENRSGAGGAIAQGSASAILSVAGSHVALAIVPFPDFLPFQDSHRILAQTVSGIETEGWMIGVFAPAETSPEEVARLSEIFRHPSGPEKTANCRVRACMAIQYRCTRDR
jgi:tripartite-type tricarboxylate transporter receptor subunit TctC